VLVNGQPQPTKEVDAGWHRVRVLNGSNARIYKLAWGGDVQMAVIGGDGGHGTPAAPAGAHAGAWPARGCISGSQWLCRRHGGTSRQPGVCRGGRGRGRDDGHNGRPDDGHEGRPLERAEWNPAARDDTSHARQERLGPPRARTPVLIDAAWSTRADAPIRRVPLSFQPMAWSLGGRTFVMGEVASEETVAACSTHLWEFINLTNQMIGMQAAHPIHLHGRQFRVVGRTGGRATNTLRAGLVDAGWKDTVLVLPGETVRVQVTFTRHPGLYLYHCHILEHEDMGMMRNFRVT